MIEIKKYLSLLIVISLILSNVAFAQYSEPSYYEGKPIDSSKEGKEYYRESSVVVYPAQTSSEEERMMQRFMKGDISEEEMRKIAKSKLGKGFDEMKFKRGMLESRERIERKEAFSYEHEGYGQRYYVGPSYEGYSKEHMVFGMVFQYIGNDIDPREIKQYCNEPEKIADITISKLKEKVGDLQKLCSQAEEQEVKCQEYAKKGCSQIGTPYVRDDATELEKLQSIAYSCPVNKDAIIKACILRSKSNIEQNIRYSTESCEKMFAYEGERLLKECERFKQNQICDKGKYIERCMGGIKKEDFEEREGKSGFMYANWQCYDGFAESQSDSSCKSSEEWQELARKSCEGHCYADKSKCGVNSFSVSGECGKVTKPICPAYPVPDCGANSKLVTKTDANGCTYYYCETIKVACPADAQQCPDGTYVKRVPPSCNFEPCPTTTTSRPSKITIEGNDGTWCYDSDGNGGYFSKGYCQDNSGSYNDFCDSDTVRDYYCTGTWNGAVWSKVKCEHGGYVCSSGNYKCSDGACITVATQCPTVQKPICQADEYIQAYYDNAGCVTTYQCIKSQTTTCPLVQKPSCAEGQSLTTRYDDKGCIIEYECVTVTTNTSSSITGYAVLSTYDDLLRRCENSWREQERACATMLESCDKDALIEKCKQQARKNQEENTARIEQNCYLYSGSEIRAAEDRCGRMEQERQNCFEESTKRCENMKGVAEKCRETLTEENLKKFMIEEVKKRCKFTAIVSDEEDVRKSDKVEIVLAILNTATKADIEKLELFVDDLKEDLKLQDTTVYKGMINPNNFGDIKLLPFVINAKISAVPSAERAKEVKAKIVARQKTEEVASKLASLRDSDVPSEYLYIIEDKASDVLDVSDNLKEIEKKEEQKGLGYKIRLFLGLAKAAEQQEIKQLGESKEKLKNSIDTLTKLIDEVPSDVAKSILKEQVENLKQQQEDIEVLIETKEKKAKGLLGLFG